MLVPKKNRLAVYSYLFKEGVIVVKKDPFLAKHATLEVPNIQAMKLLQSLKSRAYVKEQFSWQYYYYTLTDEVGDNSHNNIYEPNNIANTLERHWYTVFTCDGK